jgi:glycosyltransferase involved in cell wall biosynthesis
MHILFLTDNFPPEVNAPASRTHEHCRQWAQAGHTVTVVTCAPNFPKGKVFDGYRNRLRHVEKVDGINVIRVWSYITANEGFGRRVLDYMSFMLSGAIASLFIRKVDIVVGTSPQFFTVCAARLVAGAKRVPFVFELRDLWPESIKAVGAMKDSLMLLLLEKIELYLYRKASCIISVTHSFRRSLIKRGIDGSKIGVVTNGVDISRFSLRPRDRELEARLNLGGKFVAGYIGTHGLAHALHTLLNAASRLKQLPGGARFALLLLGDGAEKEKLMQRAKEMQLDNLYFIDTVPKSEVARYWSLLNASIIHLRQTELFTTVIPSKLFESMGMGIPILHGVSGESAEIVETEQVGLVFPSEDVEGLVAAMLRLQGDARLLADLQQNCVRSARKYDRSALAKKMLELLEATVEARKQKSRGVTHDLN